MNLSIAHSLWFTIIIYVLKFSLLLYVLIDVNKNNNPKKQRIFWSTISILLLILFLLEIVQNYIDYSSKIYDFGFLYLFSILDYFYYIFNFSLLQSVNILLLVLLISYLINKFLINKMFKININLPKVIANNNLNNTQILDPKKLLSISLGIIALIIFITFAYTDNEGIISLILLFFLPTWLANITYNLLPRKPRVTVLVPILSIVYCILMIIHLLMQVEGIYDGAQVFFLLIISIFIIIWTIIYSCIFAWQIKKKQISLNDKNTNLPSATNSNI